MAQVARVKLRVIIRSLALLLLLAVGAVAQRATVLKTLAVAVLAAVPEEMVMAAPVIPRL